MDAESKHAFGIACALLGLNQKEGMRGAVDLLLLVSRSNEFVSLAENKGVSVVDCLEEAMQDAVGRSSESAGEPVEAEGLVPTRLGSLLSQRRAAGSSGD